MQHHSGFLDRHDCDAPSSTAARTMRIFTRAGENFSVTVRGDKVVLAPNDPRDPHQHWYKDMRYSTQIKDEEGFPSFALINAATGQAIKHALGAAEPVRLANYNPDCPDESVLWSESNDVGKGFRCIRMVNNIRLNFDAFQANEESGGPRDGTIIGLWEWNKGDNQQWKIEPQSECLDSGSQHSPSSNERTVRVYCKAGQEYSLAVRDGSVILAPKDPGDRLQHWIKDMRYSDDVKDEEGCPAFALINAATGEAIKHSFGKSHPVRLVRYNPNFLDESVLWTESNDVGEGYRCIRMVNNIHLNFDAFHGDKEHGGVRDGTIVVLWDWNKGDNQKWKIVPY